MIQPPNFRLDNEVAVVTGGGSGIGRAVADGFASFGAKVAVLDVNATRTQEVAEEIGESAYALQADVANEASVEADGRRTRLNWLDAISAFLDSTE